MPKLPSDYKKAIREAKSLYPGLATSIPYGFTASENAIFIVGESTCLAVAGRDLDKLESMFAIAKARRGME